MGLIHMLGNRWSQLLDKEVIGSKIINTSQAANSCKISTLESAAVRSSQI
mgnify:CR=1 FL=1